MRIDIKDQKSFRPLVYICSPLSGDVERNLEQARRFSRFALEHGQIPLTPHLMYPQIIDDNNPEGRSLALLMDTVLLGKCQELWVLGNEITAGMKMEIDTAKRRRQRIRYFNSDFEEVQQA